MDKIAVLIPCYNESKTIEKVISSYRVNAIYVNYCKIKKRVEKI